MPAYVTKPRLAAEQRKAKRIADQLTIEQNWTKDSTFEAAEVSKLITHIVATLTEREFESEGLPAIKLQTDEITEARRQVSQIWAEIAANLAAPDEEDWLESRPEQEFMGDGGWR